MKRVSFIVIFVLILIFLFGCGQIGGDTTTTEEVYKGTKGVEMSFLPQTPPDEVFEGSPLIVLVEYANKGANTITNGALYLTGYDSAYLFDGSRYKEWSLRGLKGKSILNPVGEEKIAEFKDNEVRKPDNIDEFTQKLKLTACYDYVTTASAQVCIDPDPYNLGGGTKTCTPGIVTLSGGQGAPIAVTKIDERIAGNTVYFDIHFKNMGSGDVFIGTTSHCYTSINYEQMNRVVVDNVKLSNVNIACEPKLGDPIILNNGEGFVKCYYIGDLGADEYLTTLNINLRYGYRESITKSIDILDIPGVPEPGGPSTPSTPSTGNDQQYVGQTCYDTKGRVLGVCQFTSSACSGGYVSGRCPGSNAIKCCVTANCFDPYTSKKCKLVSMCSNPIPNKCPGPTDVQCCLD